MNTNSTVSETSAQEPSRFDNMRAQLAKGKAYMASDVTIEMQQDPEWGDCLVYTLRPSQANGHLVVCRESFGETRTREQKFFIDNQLVWEFSEKDSTETWGSQSAVELLRNIGMYNFSEIPGTVVKILRKLDENMTIERFIELGKKDAEQYYMKNGDPEYCKQFDLEVEEVRGKLISKNITETRNLTAGTLETPQS